MRRLFVATLVFSFASTAQEKKAARDADLGKKETSAAPDKSLAGDLTRKKETSGEAAPALQYDQFRLQVEIQVASKRRSQIDDLKRIIAYTVETRDERGEMPKLLFRLGELYWEESKFFFFEANRKDDEYIQAMNRKDQAAMERSKAEKQELLEKSKEYSRLAVEEYSKIVQQYKDFERSDEVLYFLGHNLMEAGEDRKALVAYKRLIEKYPKSRYLSDAHLAFGEYYFNSSKGKREMLEKALDSYKKAASDPSSAVYGFALYKQGWCYYNLTDCQKAMDMFKSVVLYAEIAGKEVAEGGGGPKGGKAGLVREARNDFVRSFARCGGSPAEARSEFARLASKEEDRWTMMKNLASLYYEDGKDKEAALAFNMLIKEKPLSPEAPGFQGKIVDCVLRAGNKRMTVEQVRRLVKVMDDVVKSGVGNKDEKAKKALDEARELSERTISNLAVNWHNEGKKTRDEETFGFANEVYADYLTLFPDNPKSYSLRFFWAELLNDNLQNYARAAEQYTLVLMRDASCADKGQKAEVESRKPAKKKKGEKEEEGEDKDKKTAHKCPGKWMVNAAYNAILAYDAVVKKAEESGKLKAEPNTDIRKKLKISPEKQALLEACERYVKYVPEGEKVVEINFKAGKIYYDHNYLDEAVQRFSHIALDFPDYKFENGDRAGEIAANLVLDSFNLQQDWAKVNEWARKFYASEKLAVGKFREDLAKLIEQSAFKLVNQLEAKKDYAKAAEAYIGFVQEFPQSELADKALFNAAIDFFNARMLDKAIETRKRLVQSYPKSQFVPQTVYALAEGYEAIADFEDASNYYEAYAREFERSTGKAPKGKKPAKKGKVEPKAPTAAQVWEESKAQISLFNAGVFRDGLGQYKQALRNRERYLELWPDSPDAEKVFLSIADLHEKNGVYGKAMKQLEEYEKKYKDPNKVLTSEGRIASIYEDRQKNAKAARRIYERIWSYYDKLPSKTKKALEITALDAVARSHFVTSEDEYRKYAGLKLRWTKLQNVNEFKTSVKEKAKALEGIQKLYTVTVGYKSADPAICALHKIGLAYDHFAKSLTNAPTPKGMPEELLTELRIQLEQQAQPIKDKAAEAFASAVTKSQELSVFNECTNLAYQQLRENYRPEQFPKMSEETVELKAEAKRQAIGGDILVSVQPVPVVSRERLEEMRQDLKRPKGQDVAREVIEDRPPREEEEAPPPAVKGKQPKTKDSEPSDEAEPI
ncbi:MAG: tetratricopeptide repeat protein [Myxococcales bacterium]|nr:tetratricopeptide repeat protein [Myxococcales bacterium]